jgi:hypothetical protein
MLQMLGAAPSRGRLITPPDVAEGAPLTVVLSDGLWKRAPRIAGRETLLDGRKATVIGVMPPGFDFPPGMSEPAEALKDAFSAAWDCWQAESEPHCSPAGSRACCST